jgi:hypothetical protein
MVALAPAHRYRHYHIAVLISDAVAGMAPVEVCGSSQVWVVLVCIFVGGGGGQRGDGNRVAGACQGCEQLCLRLCS